MTKSELTNLLSDRYPHLLHQDMERVVNTFFEEMTQALINGDRVELRGFGAFSVRERSARTSRNPRTGAPVQVAAKRTPYFKMGKDLKERINK